MGYDPEYFIIGTTSTNTSTNNNNNGISDSSSSSSILMIDDSLLCVICHTVYHTPMILDPCGHSFCKDCVTELLDTGHENCPVCRTQMLKNVGSGGGGGGIPPNRALTSFINSMTIRCMNNDISTIKQQQQQSSSDDNNSENTTTTNTCCAWTGKLSNFRSHVEKGNCPLQIIPCSVSGCTWEGYRHEHTQHNNENVEYHTTVIMETKLKEMVQTQIQIQLEQKDHEIDTLKARLLVSDNLENNVSDNLDTWLSNFFRDWIIEKQPYGRYKYFEDFVVYRPMKYLTGAPSNNNIYHLIVGIPGPSGSDWYGGLYPLLITFSNNGRKKVPPTCQFPTTFFHPNIDEDGCVHVNTLLAEHNEFGLSGVIGSWDPSISLPELFFCIQQLLVHPNHREVYDPIEYQRIVLEQSEKYQYNIGGNNGNDNADHNDSNKFLELAMVELQSNIDPEYYRRFEWENLELVRWKGQRSFQQRVVGVQGGGQQQQQQGVVGNVVSNGGRISITTPPPPRPSLVDNDNSDTIDLDNNDDDDDVQLIMTTNSNTSSIPDDEVENGNRVGDIGIGTDVRGVLNNNNTTTGGSSSSISSSSNTNSINDLISRARRTTRSLSSSVAVAVATNSNSSNNNIPTTALRDNNGNICECSCCIIGSRGFLDPSTKMRYIFGEGG
ncbi:hypothetical protein FRACYDRAFT_240827 [Fragilariopsis cylindrus CCMP1102]|uniref:UBC-like protein n=1 Tax=Fragilariopsis cylindrus CCMP1102 TaxID=635003 RepID=A0A1E7F8Y4_9STRA|nr:hypothetical protein FRACYDRAFT_240827 [Fragilariopsis cylindrus CCMP1102]|eukprot:OEU14293.1 hypothetical protein FRACYDRAFT_240827 [Fragilariopsis cylindrus CCMP1102]